jgi:hypothetical protein
MTQDQYGQAPGTENVDRGEVVPDDDTDEFPAEQAAPATRFQKVAPSPDAPADDDGADRTRSGEVGAPAPAGVTGTQAGVPAEPGLRPGDTRAAPSDLGGLAYGSLLPDAPEFRQRWHQVQFRFVDDPPGSVTEAADVIAQVTAKLEAAIAERQRSLRARWSEGTSGDTETLRATLLMYRAFLDQLTGAR